MSLRLPLAFQAFAVCTLLAAPLCAQGLRIQFETSPSVDRLRSHAGASGLSVSISGVDGKPVEEGWADIRLHAPTPGYFLSTDIPQVEGTRLFEMRLPIEHGKVEWQYSWPIRGDYELNVTATSVDGKNASKTFAITVRESASKWLTLGLFALGLFLLGFIAGRIFTVTKASVASLAFVLVLSGRALSLDSVQGSQTMEHRDQATLIVEPAVVGKPSGIVWRLNNPTGAAGKGATLNLVITQLEDDRTVFAIEELSVVGEFAVSFQFVDGSDHRVTAVAKLPDQAPIRIEQRVAVTAMEPTASQSLAPITLFLGVVALGLGVGRWSKLRARNRGQSA